jgi:exopolyphosphatase
MGFKIQWRKHMATADAINRFLRASKQSYAPDHPDQVTTVVMGNQAADLDSMASALTLAYYLSNKGTPAIPLMNIPHAHFVSRTEVAWLFGDLGIGTDLLFFRDEMNLHSSSEQGKLRLVLVDHNELEPDQANLRESVVRILDHHEDRKAYPAGCEVDIRLVGSTATLVTELYLNDGGELIDEAVGTLLLGTILLDTVNLDPEKKRVTDEDRRAADALLLIAKKDRNALFKKLQSEKFNVANLGTVDLLRRDPKMYPLGAKRLGISSIYISIGAWMEKDPDLVSGVEAYVREEKLDALITMHAIQGPPFTRNLALYVPDPERRKKATAFLKSPDLLKGTDRGTDLGLQEIDGGVLRGGGKIDLYSQENAKISRRILAPLITEDFLG